MGVIEMGHVFDWDIEENCDIVWGVEFDNIVRYITFEKLLEAKRIAAHLPQAMMVASEEIRCLVNKQKGENWPRGYKAAMKSPEADQWRAAIQRELDSLKEKKVWRVVNRPAWPKRVIPSMFRFTKHPKEAKKKHEFKARALARALER